jgi:hypothetical protein
MIMSDMDSIALYADDNFEVFSNLVSYLERQHGKPDDEDNRSADFRGLTPEALAAAAQRAEEQGVAFEIFPSED